MVWAEMYVLAMPGQGPAVGPAVAPGSATSVPAKVIQSPTSKGAWMVGSGEPPPGGSIVKLVEKPPPAAGLWVKGQIGSSGLPGIDGLAMTRGTHIGKPVSEAIVGLSWSAWNR